MDQPASIAGAVKIKIMGDATYGDEFETLPPPMDQFLNLSIEKGQKQLELILIPKEEGKFDGEKTVAMKLETVSEGQIHMDPGL